MNPLRALSAIALLSLASICAQEIAPAPIQTPWDGKVDPANVLPEYPRPQLVRDAWKNLNGRWDYALTALNAAPPQIWAGKILVPFCFESELSGVNRNIKADEWMWYRRSFTVPADWKGKRLWLNFEASDWETVVYVNGQEVSTHRHGYTPFSFDITDALTSAGEQSLVVRVWDHSGTKLLSSAGKQSANPDVYENCSGIWQTVWLEPRAAGAIASLKIHGSLKQAAISVGVTTDGKTAPGTQARVDVLDGGKVIASASGAFDAPLTVKIPQPKAWGPNNPFLYNLHVSLVQGGATLDTITSYCGLRDIGIDKTLKGPQIVLNGKAFFHFGPLDQGYWPLSVFTSPTEDALLFELNYLKEIGCNMVRLHIKRNSSRWYYHCDRLGLMVWQDFVCNRRRNPETAESEFWQSEQVMLMDSLTNHPSIVKWIVFNEAWGQTNTEAVVKWAQALLPHHLVSCASGWDDVAGLADIRDIHDYTRFPSVTAPEAERKRAVVQGETGGFGVPVNGHNWQAMPEPTVRNMSGGQVADADRKGGMKPVNGAADDDVISDMKRPVYSLAGLAKHYARYIETMRLEQAFGLSGAIYTQLTDMRHEQNGWLTFDRKVSKIPAAEMKEIHETLYRPVQTRQPLVAAATTWQDAAGKPVRFPLVFKATAATQPGKAKKGKKSGATAVGSQAPAGQTTTYTTRFTVAQTPAKAALNIFLTSNRQPDTSGFLLVSIDGRRIFDDMCRQEKDSEARITCVPLTAAQTALLTAGSHELRIEYVGGVIPLTQLDLSLDTVIGN